MSELKDERIRGLEARAGQVKAAEGLPQRVAQIETRLAFFQHILQVDPVDGHWALGAVSGPSDLSQMLSDAEARVSARDFDGALDLVRHMEEIFPDFAGAAYIRFRVNREKGYEQAAAENARTAIALAPKDRRLRALYDYLIDYRLKRNEKQEAEPLARRLLELAPEDKALAERFRMVFGFLPSSSR
jgi:tetratricopeptide (TPR) repeat protein